MLCEWTEDQDVWIPAALITLTQDSELDYQKETDPLTGDLHVGLDLGKHRDHTAAAVIQRDAEGLHLIHLKVFPLETSYGAVIGYIKRLQDNWHTINTIQVDKTGVGDYIVEDMQRGGIRNVEGLTFTEETKETLATALKEAMRRATCPRCHTPHTIDTEGPKPHTTCPTCNTTLRPQLHTPYDKNLIQELNTERYQLTKTGRIHYNHPEGTHDDRFWALALATHAATRQTPTHTPRAKTLNR
jgi:phage FluMu gp28-like protein